MVIDEFLKYLTAERRYSPLTVNSYKSDITQCANYLGETLQTDLDSATSESLRSWMACLMSNGMHPNSIHRKLSSLAAYFRFNMFLGNRDNNPCSGIKKPRRPKRLPVFLDAHATQNLYGRIHEMEEQNNFPSLRDGLMLRLLIETGMRRAELIDLKCSDVDMSYKRLRVMGKRKKVRIIPISDDFLLAINEYIKKRDEFNNSDLNAPLLLSDSGKKMSTNFVHLKVHSYLSGITTINKKSPHIMRHSFATGMLNNGADLQAIRELLGHTSLAATQIYTHNGIGKLKQIHQNKHPRS